MLRKQKKNSKIRDSAHLLIIDSCFFLKLVTKKLKCH